MDFLYHVIIYPIQLFIEIIYLSLYQLLEPVAGRCGYAIIGVSLAVSFFTLPLYLKAEKLQDIQRDILKKMEKKLKSIKRNFKGDKKYMLISAYYRKNSYHPLMILRSSLSLFIMIPFFMGAYIFLSQPQLLSGESFLFLNNLSKPDQLINLFGLKINLLPILMTTINILSGYIYSEKLSKGEKSQLYITALIFLLLLYSSPSGLVFYWTCNNIFSLCKNIWLKYNLKISLPIKFDFTSKIFDKIEALSFNSATCFILSVILIWLISGVVIPFNFVASSPLELCGICRDTNIWNVLSYPALQAFGIFVFWGILIFYLTDNKLKNLLSLFTISTVFLILINFFRHSTGLISLSFRFKMSNLINMPFYVFFILIILYYLFFIFILYKIFEKRKYKSVISVIIILIIAFIINICFNFNIINKGFCRYNEITLFESKNSPKDKKIFKFTKTGKNVLVFFLDGAINSYFPLILNRDENLKKTFEGFVYYPNTISFYCHTILGVPPIFGGYEYTPIEMNNRKEKMKDKHNEALLVLPSIFKNKNAYISLTDIPLKNYEWISDNKLFIEKGINAYNLNGVFTDGFIKNKMNLDIKKCSASVILKHDFLFYSFMKISPDFISNIFYDNEKYFNPIHILIKQRIPGESIALFDSYASFLELSNLSDFNSKENLTLNIISNDLSHEPCYFTLPKYTLEKKTSCFDKNSVDIEGRFRRYQSNAAAIYRLADFLNELKKNDVYDNTKIIIVSDHGAQISTVASDNPMLVYFNPLLTVKDFNSKGYYKIDNSFMTVADVPYIATKDVINNPVNPFTGKSIVEYDKSNGIKVINEHKYNPADFIGDKCIFEESYCNVKENVLEFKNWKIKSMERK